MCANLITSSWVSIREGCELRYYVNDGDSVDFIISGDSQLFEFECQTAALRAFVDLAQRALHDLDARAEAEVT